MAEKLTPQQAEAVHNRGGKLLVSAAAGSGKTKVLVDRLMDYLTDANDPANLDEFLIITYTKAAASELRAKIAAKLTERIAEQPENHHLQKQMQRLFLTQISTVHGFCSTVLREYAYKLDIAPDFRVADENECAELRELVLKDMMERIYEENNADASFRDFIDSQGVGRNDRSVPEIITKVYDNSRCHLDPHGWLDRCLQDIDLEGKTDVSELVWGQYLIQDLQDYLDLELKALQQCIQEAQKTEDFEGVVGNLSKTVASLTALRQAKTWEEVYALRNIDYGTLRFPGKRDASTDSAVDSIKAVRNACKDGVGKKLDRFANNSAQVLADMQKCSSAAKGLIDLVRMFDAEYTRVKKGRRVLDFSDLEQRTLDLLLGKQRSAPTGAAAEIAGRFREILVDEYQDSNGVQDAIFAALTGKKQNCFMVGDVKQSIYRFRLADPGIFIRKYLEYPLAEDAKPSQGRKVLLSHNFRSGGEVIEAVNEVFTACMSQSVGGLDYTEAEALREGVPHQPLPDPAVELHVLQTQQDTYAEEAAYTAFRIRRMLDSGTQIRDGENLRPVRPDDIVILLRAPGSLAGIYRRALESEGIRCAIGNGSDLMHSQEVETVCSLLQVIANPRQDIPLLSVLASPVFRFTADDLAAFRKNNRHMDMYDALQKSTMSKAEHFLSILTRLREKARTAPITELLETILVLTKIDSIYSTMPGGKVRSENLQIFYRMTADYEKGGIRTLDQYLDFLEAQKEKGVQTDAAAAGCVTLMSIHKSKGLEFPVVFLCGLTHKFNQEDLRDKVLTDPNLGLGLSVADNENRMRYNSVAKNAIITAMKAEGISEELRVLYVAMTRARDRLIMTCAARNMSDAIPDIARRMDMDNGKLLCVEANSPSDWILLAAMRKIEAGELLRMGRPRELHMSDHPWKIRWVETESVLHEHRVDEEQPKAVFPQDSAETIRKGLSFVYPHAAATTAPSKQTATGRKGRSLDEEVLEKTENSRKELHNWRKPSFETALRSGKNYGSAIHAVMQYIRYEACTDLEAVDNEILRLCERGYLSEEQEKMVSRQEILSFFETEIGKKLRSGTPHIREFKFSILDDAAKYAPGLEGEQVLLQGVVDCALLEEDGITVLDFKSDRVTEETLPRLTERYRPQLETYAEAIARIYEQPVKAKYLYFFRLNQFVTV